MAAKLFVCWLFDFAHCGKKLGVFDTTVRVIAETQVGSMGGSTGAGIGLDLGAASSNTNFPMMAIGVNGNKIAL
ncbi:hypothetical protein Tco_1287940 [Tanacetum coccineum]